MRSRLKRLSIISVHLARTSETRAVVVALALLLGLAGCGGPGVLHGPGDERPNIVFILADDLGYGDLGSYGQEQIRTPRLDEMAAEGMRFSQFYAGATVCAPSRSVLMTGQHTGATRVRGNAGPEVQRLKPEDVTVAEVLQDAGYHTALIGKWGLGDVGNTGRPNDQGFDYFFGYLNQVHAHNFYPEFLWRNEERVELENVVRRAERSYGGFTGGVATKKVEYSHDLFVEEALEYIDRRADDAEEGEPFFLYLSLTIPHANNEAGDQGMEVPSYGPYQDEDWPQPEKGFAAMLMHMDEGVGQIVDRLEALELDENTLVFFSSDNGPHAEGGHDPDFFDSNGPLRGIKRDLYEGGIRVPTIAYWPGTVPAGTTSDYIGYFGDFMATAAALAHTAVPPNRQSLNLVPVLEGRPEAAEEHPYLYWEFYERGSAQAVRDGRWKAVRKPMFTGEVELYDLSVDIGETNDVADEHPEIVREMVQHMEEAHQPSPDWVVRR